MHPLFIAYQLMLPQNKLRVDMYNIIKSSLCD